MLRRHPPAAKRDALHFEARALFEGRAHAQPDFAADSGDTLPGQGIAALAQELCDQAVIERISGCRSDGRVGRGLALGDVADDVEDGGVAQLVRPLRFARQGPFELMPREHYTPQQ